MYANRGRTRSILSGRGAAISLRVIPLEAAVHKSLDEGQVVKGSEDALITLGAALNLQRCDDDADNVSAASVLERLKDSLLCLGANGNAMIESPSFMDGSCAFGIISNSGELYVPRSASDKGEESVGESNDLPLEAPAGKGEFEELLSKIRLGTRN